MFDAQDAGILRCFYAWQHRSAISKIFAQPQAASRLLHYRLFNDILITAFSDKLVQYIQRSNICRNIILFPFGTIIFISS